MADRSERGERLRQGLERAGFDALLVALPGNVALLSGYFPVVGTSLALLTARGRLELLVPADEAEAASAGRADRVRPYHPGSLDRITRAVDAIEPILRKTLGELKLLNGTIGLEAGPAYQPASYASMHLFLDALPALVRRLAPEARLGPADQLLTAQRAVLVAAEIDRLRTAAHRAGEAFEAGRTMLRPGLPETVVAGAFRAPLLVGGDQGSAAERGDGFVYCMSGPNAARAGGAYAQSGGRRLAAGDLVLVHCNSFVDGLWTDITRTYYLGSPGADQRRLYQAVFAARGAALAAIRPGMPAAAVDRAARQVLAQAGYGHQFVHPAGHGVGFAAIDHDARPRLHPQSPDRLEPGMVCNLEPAVYLSGIGGLRHCDLILVTDGGPEVLTPFQQGLDDLTVSVPA